MVGLVRSRASTDLSDPRAPLSPRCQACSSGCPDLAQPLGLILNSKSGSLDRANGVEVRASWPINPEPQPALPGSAPPHLAQTPSRSVGPRTRQRGFRNHGDARCKPCTSHSKGRRPGSGEKVRPGYRTYTSPGARTFNRKRDKSLARRGRSSEIPHRSRRL